ncbi:AMP-dependent synthetase/ligase [Desmospora profundinema]|uniref:Long-chain acyl-CoA synthetase n=1 Tax=Desmospora profundinema TaxID=1571184 RepID=A0ABU1IP31_9BACL|nr:long-chain fatty acid--CoA ligase [Desmospora profundinema]MDR6226545.1 long-chain acyl-CoA synthetase [Desmospora profundinema]
MKAKNLLEMVYHSVQRYPDKAVLMWKSDGSYRSMRYGEFWEEVRHVAAGLAQLGVGRNDKVAIVSENNPKWPVSDLAICSLGAVSVPIYPTLPSNQVTYILQNADCRVAVVENRDQLKKVVSGETNIHRIVVMHPGAVLPRVERVWSFFQLAKNGAEHPLENWERIWSEIDRDQLASIIHTSGTTGEPKGAMLTHGNFLSNIEGVQFWCLEARPDDVTLSYLPLSHVFERMAGQFLPLSVGATIAYAESIDTIQDNLQEVKPTGIITVPRLLEKVYARVQDQIKASTPLRRKIFDWAVQVGMERYEYILQQPMDRLINGEWPPFLRQRWKCADRLVYRKVKARLGGNLRGVISGGAALNPEIARFFWAINIPVLEGYGLTETSPVVASNPIVRAKAGTVGKPLPNLEVRIASDGEVLVRGPNVMKGYYKNEEATAQYLKDGWFSTGDLGEIDEEGYLKIVDRKKRILVLSTGKNVAPQPVEHAINQSTFIEQSAVIGHQRKFVIVLVIPDWETLIPWARKKGIPSKSRSDLVRHPEVQKQMVSMVKNGVKAFAPHEQPKKVVILSDEWTVETGECSPSLKVRIHEVERKYKEVIRAAYSEDGSSKPGSAVSEVAATAAIHSSVEGKA